MSEKYGDFEEVFGEEKKIDANKNKSAVQNAQESIVRVRMPRQGELIGVIVQRYGGNRMEVIASDGKSRNCRVPGRFKRALWLRPKDIVLLIPWKDDNEKGDIIFKYHGSAINQLRKRGMLDNLKLEF